MKISEEMIKEYIHYSDEENKVREDIKNYKRIKYNELNSKYTDNQINEIVNTERKVLSTIQNEGIFMGIMFSSTLFIFIPLLIYFIAPDKNAINMKVMINMFFLGVIIILLITNHAMKKRKLFKMYKQIYRELHKDDKQ